MMSTCWILLLTFWFSLLPLSAAEYFVSPQGKNDNDGLTKATAFQTIQRGLDALEAGDTLTIRPGEYEEAVHRKGLGREGVTTRIRAEIPGTVLLRGDRRVESFEKVPGTRFVYRAPFPQEPEAVREIDTFTKFDPMTAAAQLDVTPGAYFYDATAGMLYLSPSDFQAPFHHHYRASVTPLHGLYLENPVGVVISGLAATGFDSREGVRRSGIGARAGMHSVWGFMVFNGKGCRLENLTAFFNGGGIAVQNRGMKDETHLGGGNVITGCTAYGNGSRFAMEGGDIATYFPNGDVIEHSTSEFGVPHGIRLYQRAGEFSWLRDNFARGNPGQGMQNKGKFAHEKTRAERCITLTNLASNQVSHCIIGGYNYYHRLYKKETSLDNIYLSRGPIDQNAEFADPENFDFRLQSTSRFRKSGPDGADRGPFPYEANIHYVKPDGDDAADGLSLATAWKTAAHALRQIRPGETLYFEPGEYDLGDDATLRKLGDAKTPTFLRGRGRTPAILRGDLKLEECRNLHLERLDLRGAVTIQGGDDLELRQSRVQTVTVAGKPSVTVRHCRFDAFENGALVVEKGSQPRLFLQSNQYVNADGPALVLPAAGLVAYSGYNQFEKEAAAWKVKGKMEPLTALQPVQEQNSGPLHVSREGVRLTPPAVGALGRPAGPYAPFDRALRITAPTVRNTTATTANLEWFASLPVRCEIAWGPTPECENRDVFEVNGFATYSLYGLEPGKPYYFRITALSVPKVLEDSLSAAPAADWKSERISFTTAEKDREPRTFHVSPNGADNHDGLSVENAWRTIGHAARQVQPGDTVVIEPGVYSEQVVLPATGDKGKPITFRAKKGVVLDGDRRRLSRAFLVGGKGFIRFDGFHSRLFGLTNEGGRWPLHQGGVFHLYKSRNIEITRCFNDGRGGSYSAPLVQAAETDGLQVRNSVAIVNAGAIRLSACPNTVIENNVILRSNIQNIIGANHEGEMIRLRNNILGDNQLSKAHVQTFEMGRTTTMDEGNNCYFFRIADEKRKPYLFGDLGEERRISAAEFNRRFGKEPSLITNPGFAGMSRVTDRMGLEYDGDAILTVKELDFADFFPTAPEVVEKKIGLQPEAFKR